MNKLTIDTELNLILTNIDSPVCTMLRLAFDLFDADHLKMDKISLLDDESIEVVFQEPKRYHYNKSTRSILKIKDRFKEFYDNFGINTEKDIPTRIDLNSTWVKYGEVKLTNTFFVVSRVHKTPDKKNVIERAIIQECNLTPIEPTPRTIKLKTFVTMLSDITETDLSNEVLVSFLDEFKIKYKAIYL